MTRPRDSQPRLEPSAQPPGTAKNLRRQKARFECGAASATTTQRGSEALDPHIPPNDADGSFSVESEK